MTADHRDKHERVAEVAGRIRAVADIESKARTMGLGAWAVSAFVVFTSMGAAAIAWVIPILGFTAVFGYAVRRLARWVMYRAEGTAVPLTEWAEEAREKEPVGEASSYAVPRLRGLDSWSDADVADAPPLEDIPVLAAAGGRLSEMDANRGSLGALMMTQGGIVFLPDADVARAGASGVKQAAGVAWEFAKDKLPLVDVLLKAGLDPKIETPKSTPTWIVESQNHKDHFAVAWTQIVEVSYTPSTVRTTIVRERDDGQRESFAFRNADDSIPAFVMNQRFTADKLRVVYERLLLPKQKELIPTLTEKFREIYGDRLSDHASEIVDEAGRQASAWAKSTGMTVDSFAAGEMLEIASTYRRIPGIEERNKEFFAAIDASRKAKE